MSVIHLQTEINAPAKICFDLSRSVDAHISSMENSNEKAVAGKTSGLLELNDSVTWEAKHFGIRQQLMVKITKMEKYSFFEDTIVKGAFKSMEHQHYFEEKDGKTTMRDVFTYEVPGWIFGKVFDVLILKRYMMKLLANRNQALKALAEKAETLRAQLL